MKTLKKMLTVVLAVAMIASLAVTAFAADPVRYNDKSKFYLTKQMNIANALGNYNETFTFTFTADTKNVNGPAIKDQTITIKRDSSTNANVEEIIAAELLDLDPTSTTTDVTWDAAKRHAGEFKFTVQEKTGTTTGVTYDTNKYILSVAYKNTTDSAGNPTLSVGQVSVQKDNAAKDKIADADKNVNDSFVDADNDGVKDADELAGNSFRFVNTKTATVNADEDADPHDPAVTPDDGKDDGKVDSPKEAPYYLTNAVAGTYADKTKEFTYAVTVKIPTGLKADDFVKLTNVGGTGTYTLSDSTFTVKLSDGENFYFKSLPAGAVVTAVQKVETNYKVTCDNVDKDTSDSTYTTKYTVNAKLTDNTGVAYTNTFDDAKVNLTGVIVENMPFVVLSVLAITGCALVVVTRRKRDAE